MNTETIERNEIFDLAFRFVTETSENIFLTGKAGTGKTTFLKYLKDHCTKNILVAAPTGVAAINAGGVTLHSLFQLPFHPFLPTRASKEELIAKTRFNKQRQQLLIKMELLVIDEISMVRSDVVDAIDCLLRHVRRSYDQPFGGVQLLCIGDLHQLPPVAQQQEWLMLQEYYESPFFFDSYAIKEQAPLLIELDKIYRQKEGSFVSLLNKIRNNNMDADDFEDLHLRYKQDFVAGTEDNYITLCSHNKQADQINQQALNRIIRPPYTYHAVIDNDFSENLYPADAALILKEGAQVMFLKNDPVFKRFYNGKIGVVIKLEKEKIVVACGEEEIEVNPETWENSRYVLNKTDGKLEQDVLGTFSQYPLRLAWAITIHKSQGLTFDKVMIDAGSAFSSGQVYVALSRCTSLEGIVLLSKIPQSAIMSNELVIKGQQSLTHRGSLAERFTGARQLFTLQMLEKLFSFNDLADEVGHLFSLIRQHRDKLNDPAVSWAEGLRTEILKDKNTGTRFSYEVAQLMKENPEIETNQPLQKRINDAAGFFLPRLKKYTEDVHQHPVITEQKEVANLINETLNNFYVTALRNLYYIQYCSKSFSVTDYLKHKLDFKIPNSRLSIYATGKKQDAVGNQANTFFETLKNWRDHHCESSGMPIYMLANKETLLEIATYLPQSRQDLLKISGFGKAKVEKFGDEILELVRDFCEMSGMGSTIDSMPIKKSSARDKVAGADLKKKDTKLASLALYLSGVKPADIATQRNLSLTTIEGHLSFYVGTGKISIRDFVNEKTEALIDHAIMIHGDSQKILKQNLPENISYGDIKMVLAKKGVSQ